MTGGTGFVGSHTVEYLLKSGFEVRCLVRRGRLNRGWLEGLPTHIIEANLLDRATLSALLDGVDYVFHIAGVTKAKRQEDYFVGNVTATRNLLEAASKRNSIKKFCFVSSLTAAGPSYDGTPLDETAPCHPITAYGVSKLQAEQVVLNYSEAVPSVILRPPAVYGPRDKDILEMFRTAKLGFKPIIGSKNKTLSLIHVADLARAIVQTATSTTTEGKIYFVTDERVYQYGNIYDELARIIGKTAISVNIPSAILYTLAATTEFVSVLGPRPAVLSIDKARELLQTHWVCSGKKLKADIGYETVISVQEGLRATYEWYEGKGWLSLRTMLGRHN